MCTGGRVGKQVFSFISIKGAYPSLSSEAFVANKKLCITKRKAYIFFRMFESLEQCTCDSESTRGRLDLW